MRNSMIQIIQSLCFLLLIICCTPSKKISVPNSYGAPKTLRFLGEYDIPHNLSFQQTTVGGLSGIDYDHGEDLYYMIADDRSATNPARFYTARIFLGAKGIDSVRFLDVKTLLQANGQAYPNNKQDPYHVPDPESIRYNPSTQQLVWTSEGERIVNQKDMVLENPAINIVSKNGNWLDSFPLPPKLTMQSIEKGPRQNSVLEGASFADDFKTLFISVEEPLYEDADRAETFDTHPYIRLFKFDATTKTNTAQYAYKLEQVAYAAMPATSYKINGISEILSLGNDQLLIMERSFSSGRISCTIKVFIADMKNATNVMGLQSLRENKEFIPCTKKLLLNMDSLGIYIDNIEGVTWGPVLMNGHRTLLFMADNNFSLLEKSQLLLFEVVE